MFKSVTLSAVLLSATAQAQLTPAITAWIINPGGQTGYNGIPSNVQQVAYSANNVYVGATGIPGYVIGPWIGNPNDAGDQAWVFKIPLAPVQNTGTLVNTPLGHIGVWINGVTIFNPRDAMSFNMLNVWHQNAKFFEGSGFDACLGHPNQQMEYHTHINPTCVYDDTDSTQHSPIIGYAFDGFPIYGAFGYANTDGTGAFTRMRSSSHLRSITDRTTLPDGTVLGAAQYGPAISGQYPLGAYIEDFEFIQGSGDLDEHNGRFCVTPEYPNGVYAYFVTLDASLQPEYPYVLGPAYYGTVPAGNTGPGSGHNDITEAVTVYTGAASIDEASNSLDVTVYPRPASDVLNILVNGTSGLSFEAVLLDVSGRELKRTTGNVSDRALTMNVADLPSGTYALRLMGNNALYASLIVVTH